MMNLNLVYQLLFKTQTFTDRDDLGCKVSDQIAQASYIWSCIQAHDEWSQFQFR